MEILFDWEFFRILACHVVKEASIGYGTVDRRPKSKIRNKCVTALFPISYLLPISLPHEKKETLKGVFVYIFRKERLQVITSSHIACLGLAPFGISTSTLSVALLLFCSFPQIFNISPKTPSCCFNPHQGIDSCCSSHPTYPCYSGWTRFKWVTAETSQTINSSSSSTR